MKKILYLILLTGLVLGLNECRSSRVPYRVKKNDRKRKACDCPTLGVNNTCKTYWFQEES